MNKFLNMLLTLFLSMSTANALELGQIKLDSYLNEPLNASFTLGNIESDHVADVLITLANQDSYKSFGITKPSVLNKVKFKISADTKDRYLVNVSTQQRIKDPILDLLVKVTEKQGSVTRLYTLILDPRDAFISIQAATPQITTDHIIATSTNDVAPAKASQAINQKQTDNAAPKRIKVVNDSLSMLAQNSEFHDRYSVYQIMRAYYLLNTEAFRDGNINHLKAGVTLIVPDEELIAEVSRQKSINFVYSASKNNPFNKIAAAPESVKSTSSAQTTNLTEEVMADVEQQNAVTQQQTALAQNAVQTEIEKPQLTDQESGSLSAPATDNNEINSTQQNIITQQQAEIEKLKQTLATKLDEIENINNRLNALELQNNNSATVETKSDTPIPPPPVIQVEPVKETSPLESYGYVISLAAAFIVLLFLINREIIWRRRLEEFDAYILQSQKETVKDDKHNKLVSEEINLVSKPDIASKATPLEAGQNQTNLDDVFAKTIVEEIHYKPKSRDIPDKNDIETIEYEPVINEKDDSDEVELDFNLDFSDDEIEITDEINPVENTLELDEESLEDFNLQLADEKFQSAVNAAKNYRNEDSNDLQSIKEEKKDPQILFSEIDVLIAYELYEEAFELIKKSREDLEYNKGDLDIRELEILAYLKNEELFFPMFDRLKHSLSKEYPVEWKKITELSTQMTKPGPKLTAVF